MRRMIVEQYGLARTMACIDDDDLPAPALEQVRVTVERAGIAFADVLMREGRYPGGPVPPYTPGWDLLGVVDAVGDGVDSDLVGRRVAALVFRGGYATHAIANVALTVPVPSDVSPDAAACLALNYVTAWQMVVRLAAARNGERLLVRGAAGGVGSAVLDIARVLGVSAWGVASAHKAETVARFGAVWLDDRKVESEAAHLGGFDIVLDPLGSRETWRSMRLLARGGRVITYGFSAFPHGLLPLRVAWHLAAMRLRSMLSGGRSARFYRLSRSARTDPAAWRADMAALFELLAKGDLQPLVAEVLPLTAAASGHERLRASSIVGKLLLDPALQPR